MTSTITIGGGTPYTPTFTLDPADSLSTEGILFYSVEGIIDDENDISIVSLEQGDSFEGHWIGITVIPVDEALAIGFDAFDVIVDIEENEFTTTGSIDMHSDAGYAVPVDTTEISVCLFSLGTFNKISCQTVAIYDGQADDAWAAFNATITGAEAPVCPDVYFNITLANIPSSRLNYLAITPAGNQGAEPILTYVLDGDIDQDISFLITPQLIEYLTDGLGDFSIYIWLNGEHKKDEAWNRQHVADFSVSLAGCTGDLMPEEPFLFVDPPAAFTSNNEVTVAWNVEYLNNVADNHPFIALKTPSNDWTYYWFVDMASET